MVFTVDRKKLSQPIEFAFGKQVKEFSGKDKGKTWAIIGIGDVLEKFTGPPLWRRGADLILLGRDPKKLEKAVMRAQQALKDLHGKHAGIVTSRLITTEPGDTAISDLPDDLEGIYIITPPNSHEYYVRRITKEKPNTPIALEKPVTVTGKEALRLAAFVKAHNAPIYGVDWTLLSMQPLLYALHKKISYPGALNLTKAKNFAKFDTNNVVAVDARDIESADNTLGDPMKVDKNRAWMGKRKHGGGVIPDMVTHMTDALIDAGFHNAGLTEVFLGTPLASKDKSKAGIFRRVANEVTGELYSETHGFVRHGKDPRKIPLTIVSGKNGKWNHQFIRLTDKNGYVLHWEVMAKYANGKTIPNGGSRLDMYDPQGKIIASATLTADCYVLAADEFGRFAKQYKKTGKVPGPEVALPNACRRRSVGR